MLPPEIEVAILSRTSVKTGGNTQSTRNYNSLLEREEVKDNYGRVIGYRKWNDLLERYDVFDSNGSQIGYYKYNTLLERWEYFRR